MRPHPLRNKKTKKKQGRSAAEGAAFTLAFFEVFFVIIPFGRSPFFFPPKSLIELPSWFHGALHTEYSPNPQVRGLRKHARITTLLTYRKVTQSPLLAPIEKVITPCVVFRPVQYLLIILKIKIAAKNDDSCNAGTTTEKIADDDSFLLRNASPVDDE